MYTPQDVFDGYEDKIKRMAADIKQLQGDNAKLRAEIIALEGVAEIMDCGHERRFSTLVIGATGNESTCALCENARLKEDNACLRVGDWVPLSEKDRLQAEIAKLKAVLDKCWEDNDAVLLAEIDVLKAALKIHPL